jgi:large subunit ribosomal protein L15
MPLKQRLPKFGFTSRKSLVRAEVSLHELNLIKGDVVDIHALKDAGLITRNIVAVKVMLSGEITRPITLRGIAVTKGAQAAIEAAGGKIEE